MTSRQTIQLILVISVFFFLGASVSALTCGSTTGTPPAGAVVLVNASGVDNAHVEQAGGTRYTNKVYCLESGVTLTKTTTFDQGTLINISALLNGHAEIGTQTNYANHVTLHANTGTITTAFALNGDPCLSGYVPVIRLSDITNAHVQLLSSTQPAYPVTVCANYSGSGSGSDPDVLNLTITSGGNNVVPSTGTKTITFNTQTLISGYTSMAALQVTALCDEDSSYAPNGKKCSEINSYEEYNVEILKFLQGQTSIFTMPQTIQVDYYRTSGNPPLTTWDIYYNAFPAGVSKTTTGMLPPSSNTPKNYTINPTTWGLPNGHYRVLGIQQSANYNNTAVLANEKAEQPAFLGNNFVSKSMIVTGGTGAAEDILEILPANITGGDIPVPQDETETFSVTTTNKIANDPLYTDLSTLQFIAICKEDDTSTFGGSSCKDIDTFSEFFTQLTEFVTTDTPADVLVNDSIATNLFQKQQGTSLTLWANTYVTFLSKGVTGTVNPSILTSATTTSDYIIDPATMGLLPGTYRLLVADTQANYDNAILGSNQFETGFENNNFSYKTFTIVDPNFYGEGGAGGDVYVLKGIDFSPNPPIENGAVQLLLTVQNRRADISETLMAKASITIRDEQGNKVTSYDPFPEQVIDFTSGNTVTQSIDLIAPNNLDFKKGKTYTAYVTIVPFVDTNPVDGDDSETIKGNNSGFQTFTFVKPVDPLPIPDSPWWMSIVVVAGIMGWLFVASRGNEE